MRSICGDRIVRSVLACIALVYTVTACVDVEGPVQPSLEPNDILADVRLSTQAITMQVGDSLDLSVQARAADGSLIPIPDPSTVNWQSRDSTRLRLSSTGRLFGLKVTPEPVQIIVTWTHSRTSKADTIPVVVTTSRFDVTSVRMVALDSQSIGDFAFLGSARIRVDGYIGDSLAITGANVQLRASAPVKISRMAGQEFFTIENPNSYIGPFTIAASGNVYGQEVKDSLVFMGVYPAVENFPQANAGSWQVIPAGDTIPYMNKPANFVQPCALVFGLVITGDRPVDIVFSDSAEGSSDDCEPSDPFGFLLSREVISGNVLNIPAGFFGYVGRKSRTLGPITWYFRYADTKEPLNQFGRYISKLPASE